MDIVLKAIEVATKAHKGQRRKSNDMDYIAHPMSVGMLLKEHRLDNFIVSAGILHDVIEDTDYTYKDLEEIFGTEVATMVKDVSEVDKSVSWEERKEQYISHLKNKASHSSMYVCCADKVHNLSNLEEQLSRGVDVWGMFKRGKDKQSWFYTEVYQVLSTRMSVNHPLMKEYNRLLKSIFKVYVI